MSTILFNTSLLGKKIIFTITFYLRFNTEYSPLFNWLQIFFSLKSLPGPWLIKKQTVGLILPSSYCLLLGLGTSEKEQGKHCPQKSKQWLTSNVCGYWFSKAVWTTVLVVVQFARFQAKNKVVLQVNLELFWKRLRLMLK